MNTQNVVEQLSRAKLHTMLEHPPGTPSPQEFSVELWAAANTKEAYSVGIRTSDSSKNRKAVGYRTIRLEVGKRG